MTVTRVWRERDKERMAGSSEKAESGAKKWKFLVLQTQ